MANVLSRDRQLLCLKMLAEGASIRATEGTMQVHQNTIMRLMVKFGEGCLELLDIKLRGLDLWHLQIDEPWTWVAKKQKNCTDAEKESGSAGDQYLWIALDEDTKLIACHRIGKRNEQTTRAFIDDLAGRLVLPDNVNVPSHEKPQLSTDGWASYPGAILDTFGSMVQYGQIIKNYTNPEVGRYAPPDFFKCDRRPIQLVSDLWTICTAHVERFNCTTRMFVKRFCRLTLAFSKRLANLEPLLPCTLQTTTSAGATGEQQQRKAQAHPSDDGPRHGSSVEVFRPVRRSDRSVGCLQFSRTTKQSNINVFAARR